MKVLHYWNNIRKLVFYFHFQGFYILFLLNFHHSCILQRLLSIFQSILQIYVQSFKIINFWHFTFSCLNQRKIILKRIFYLFCFTFWVLFSNLYSYIYLLWINSFSFNLMRGSITSERFFIQFFFKRALDHQRMLFHIFWHLRKKSIWKIYHISTIVTPF